MIRRTFFGVLAGWATALASGRRAQAAPAPDRLVPPHIVRWLDERSRTPGCKMFFSVEDGEDGKEVWARCHF
jgi:hypothetical protein